MCGAGLPPRSGTAGNEYQTGEYVYPPLRTHQCCVKPLDGGVTERDSGEALSEYTTPLGRGRMANQRTARTAVCVMVTGLVAACGPAMQRGTTDATLRQPLDPPARFVTADGVASEDGCRMTMIDPRDQTSLRLARSAQYGMSYRGDYEVATGRYGIQQGELLRIDCSTGEVIGIVRAS
jgi:hypothetical protein